MRRFATCIALLFMLALGACGGGGGGGGAADGGGGGGGAGPTFSADFFPLASDDRRLYASQVGSLPATRTLERIGAAATVGGLPAFESTDETGDVSYVAATAQGVFELPGPRADAITRALGAVELLRFGLAPDQSVVTTQRTVSADIDGDGRAETLDFSLRSRFVGLEPVQTALASYPQAARVQSTLELTIRFANSIGTLRSSSDEWFVAGIGRVRSAISTTVDNGPPVTVTEELTAYRVGARRSESTAPTLLQGPAPDSFVSNRPQIVLRFSKAMDPSSFAGNQGLQLLDAAGTPVPGVQVGFDGDERGVQLLFTSGAPLADGRYTLRLGGGIADWVDNRLGARDIVLRVDTTAARLQASTPAVGAEDAALSGALSFTFDEPVRQRGTGSLSILIEATATGVSDQIVPATLNGNQLTATLAKPLQRNTAYRMSWLGTLEDAAGNLVSPSTTSVSFRTDPGPLARPVPLAAGLNIESLGQGDLDGDGRPDLVYAANVIGTSTGVIEWRRALPAGGFGPPQRIFTGASGFPGCAPTAYAFGDFDGDGRPDLAFTGCTNPLTVLRQTAPGSFVPELVPVSRSSLRIDSGDLDGDGRPELLISEVSSKGNDVVTRLRFLRREASGTWADALVLEGGGSYIADLRWTDLDGDGQRDLVWLRLTNFGPTELVWARRQGAGFAPPRSLDVTGGDRFFTDAQFGVGDLNGDGRPDVVIVGRDDRLGGFGSGSALFVLRQNSAGGFEPPVLVPSALGAAVSPLVADLNGDGRADVVLGHNGGRAVGVFLQSAAGVLEDERLFEASADNILFSSPLLVLDFNGDGRVDVLHTNDVLLARAWPAGQAWPAGTGGSSLRRQGVPGERGASVPPAMR